MRQIVLDTETTGLEVSQGHRVIEIGCVELIDRRLTGRHFHRYIKPEREIDEGALEVHGISNDFLADKPVFAQIIDDFVSFIDGAELIIHNAPFDIGFLDSELSLQGGSYGRIRDRCSVVDTLELARSRHPGQKNNLDALCKRYSVDNSQRDLHGALLDAEILADVYLLMTGGQTALALDNETQRGEEGFSGEIRITRLSSQRKTLAVPRATDAELGAHQERLRAIDKSSGGKCLWLMAGDEQHHA
jgi:DNA polymerase III subunit epsilon